MKYLIALLLSTLLISCAHHHKNPEHHHHAFDKKCAYSVSHGNISVDGKDEYKLEHGGKTYYFSTEDKKRKFMENIEKSVNAANRSWVRLHER